MENSSTKEMVIKIDDAEFKCSQVEPGHWLCCGKIGEIEHNLAFPCSSATHVFQYIHHLISNRL